MIDAAQIATEPTPADAHRGRRARIALAHDWLCGMRGGEHVLERIASIVLDDHAPSRLYTMFDDRTPHAEHIDRLDRTPSFLSRLPGGAGRLRRWLLPLYPAAVAALSRRLASDHDREPIDLLVSTSSAAIKGIAPPRAVPHLCYCHSPARYLWSQSREYARGDAGPLRALGLRLCSPLLRRWDRATAANVTRFLANSSHTSDQIRRCYGRGAHVVHPPVRTDFFTPDESVPREDFWLVVAALEPYKRADLAVEAARRARTPLTVVGAGTQLDALRRSADPRYVTFTGRIDDDALRDLYRRARLLLFPQIEDFGIVAAESLACGTPVVARRAGGALDIVEDGRTGSFFDSPDPDAIIEAARRAPEAPAAACRESAMRFSEAAFDAAVRAHIHDLLSARAEH